MEPTPPGPDAEIPPILNATEIARLLHISPRVAARWLVNGYLPSKKIGKRRFVLREELLRVFRMERGQRRQ